MPFLIQNQPPITAIANAKHNLNNVHAGVDRDILFLNFQKSIKLFRWLAGWLLQEAEKWITCVFFQLAVNQ